MANLEALREIRADIVAHPERLEMDYWGVDTESTETPTGCGTAQCVAGKAVINAGYIPVWHFLAGRWAFSDVIAPGWKFYTHPEHEDVETVARELLDLTQEEADHLFTPRVYDGTDIDEDEYPDDMGHVCTAEEAIARIDELIARHTA